MNRRTFLSSSAVVIAAGATIPWNTPGTEVLSRKLPRWRGFNLLEKFTKRNGGNPPFAAMDFAWMEEWGFDFARLPMSYLCWSDSKTWLTIDEKEITDIDQAIELGRKHRVHINLNFHRAPGYCVNPPAERLSLWDNEEALEACSHHWAYFAKRYKGIPNARLSFDLLNEPADIPEEKYAKVVRALVAAIRGQDSDRLIIADGLKWGRDPVFSLADLGIAQSTRGYDPMRISHWKANWIHGSENWPVPDWPLKEGSSVWDKDRLRSDRIAPWKELEKKGVGVHVGEWGPFNRTPHGVALKWMRDQLALWQEAGWGWAVWNLRGPFGVVDSGRSDVDYEEFHGHKLDRKMLQVLQAG